MMHMTIDDLVDYLFEPFDTFEHAGLLIELHYDEDCSSPQDNDNAGTIYSWTRDFDGDEEINEPDYFYPDEDSERVTADADLGAYMSYHYDAVLTLPLRFSDYGSGARIFVSNDPNCCICFTQRELDEEWNGSVDDATKYATARIGELDQYLQGECYGYVIKRADGSDIELSNVHDSCWGFIDGDVWRDDSYTRSVAREAAEYVRSALDDEERERLEWAARDVVTL